MGIISLVKSYLKSNIFSSLEYRTSFISQLFGMFINDALWVIFWVIYFQKFPILKGWQINDLLTMWAIITFSFGLSFGLFSNIGRLSELITKGELDYYLTLPPNVLLHLSISQIRVVNLGDMLFGPVLLFLFVPLTWEKFAMFLLVSILAAIIFYSFSLLIGSLAFYIGNSESLAMGVTNALIHFTTYPTRIFEGWIRVILFTILPAGFICEIPVELVREFHWLTFAQLIMGAILFFAIATFVFYRGLKRYESGNMLIMRG